MIEAHASYPFSVCLMNPPYMRSKHLEFLEKVIEMSKNVVSIQPIRWLQDPVVEYKKNTDYAQYENSISKHISDIELYDANQTMKAFGADFTMNMGIYMIDHAKEYDEYKHVKYIKNGYDISFISNIIEKIVHDNNFSKLNVQAFNDGLENFVPINRMTGENIERCKPTCCIKEWARPYKDASLYRYDKAHTPGVARGKIENDRCVVFDTYDEAVNCFNSFTKSKFTRFYMSAITSDINIYQKFMPWMTDYTQAWDDKRFYEYFDIDNDSIRIIEQYADDIIERLNKHKR